MPGPIERLRDHFAPGVHAGKIAHGKLSNKNTQKVRHWGHKIAQSKIVVRLRVGISNLTRSFRSKRVTVRRVTPLESEVLDALNNGRKLDFEKLRKLDFTKTDDVLKKWETGLDAIKNGLPDVRAANKAEMQHISNLGKQRAENYQQKLKELNTKTLNEDFDFVPKNPKMVRDYAMYRMLQKGVLNEGGELVTLPKHFKDFRSAAQHEIETKTGELASKVYELKVELRNKGIPEMAIEARQDVVSLNQQISALEINEGEVLKAAMNAFKKDVTEYGLRLNNALVERQQEAEQGTHVLNPKPLLNWKAAATQDLANQLEYYTKPENIGQRHTFAEYYHSVLDLPSGRYRHVAGLSRQLKQQISKMKTLETSGSNMQGTQDLIGNRLLTRGVEPYVPVAKSHLSQQPTPGYDDDVEMIDLKKPSD